MKPNALSSLLLCSLLGWACTGAWAQNTGTATPASPLPAVTEAAGVKNHPNGQVQRRIEQSRSQRSDRSYFPTGVLQREVVWGMNGKAHVPERDLEYASTGVLLRERRWACGELMLDVQYLATGVLVSKKEVTGLGSTRELSIKEYLASGVLVNEQHLALLPGGQTRPIGVQKQWDASARPVREQTYDEQGKLTDDKTWNTAGELINAK